MKYNTDKLFYNIKSDFEFEKVCFKLLKKHYKLNTVYRSYCDLINRPPESINSINEIPFLPISFFKTHEIKTFSEKPKVIFQSSGTTNKNPSKLFLKNTINYKKSFFKSFEMFYGDVSNWTILALLPGYSIKNDSSLIFMVTELIKKTKSELSGFFLEDYRKLRETLISLESKKQKTILIGVSFALLDFIKTNKLKLEYTTIVETGGMKGNRKELVRKELHEKLCAGFGVEIIHSEYGMTELLSQAYSKKSGKFKCPPWMRVFTREIEDPLTACPPNKIGSLNIIDLANTDSCPFIATEDIGKVDSNGSFEVLGRLDQAEVRGCNLLVTN